MQIQHDSAASPVSYNLAGWSLKTSRGCSLAEMARTSRQSFQRLPNAGIWDAGGCWMLHASESPQNAVAYSLLPVFASIPPSSCWLTPAQWQLFLARRQRNNPGSSLSLHYLPDKPPARSLSMVQASSLKPTDGIRWLSGPERLSIMGFALDWMRPTLQRLRLPATPLCRKSWNGSPGS